MNIVPGSIMDRRRVWYVFRAFNLYRLIVVGLLLAVFLLDPQTRFLGKTNPSLFLITALVYAALVLLSIAGSYRRQPPLQIQVHFQALVDLISLSVLIQSSGGTTSSLSILLVTAVAASGILLPMKSVLLAAALAFFLLLGSWLQEGWGSPLLRGEELGRMGILGASCFVAALLTYTLAENTRRSEALARQRSHELLALAGLNQAIIQHLKSGIMVVDHLKRIRLMNDTARELLHFNESAQALELQSVSMPLSQSLENWLQDPQPDPKPFRQAEHLPDIIPKFSYLDNGPANELLIFLEDSAQASQRLQQIKLAALGRLTASIAHEIRNPLTSISHAAQLLLEADSASATQHRLAQIIHDNSKRANTIIANVQDLSRRDRLKSEDLALGPWLQDFCREFLSSQREQPPDLDVQLETPDLTVRFDQSHLYQILWNLCSNACLHGAQPDQTPRILLKAGLTIYAFLRPKPFLEVIDFGPGIPESDLEKIFEPFFTTKTLGTGLGLYIAREMCEANGAQLQYLRAPQGGSCFRITFAQNSSI